MGVKKCRFGVLSDGTKVKLYTIDNGAMSFSVTDYGCIVTSIKVPDKNGVLEDVALGYSTLEGYINDRQTYFGSLVGRFANRIANARFSLNGTEYCLDANNGRSCLHGGFNGYNRMVWKAKILRRANETGIRFSRVSQDGEQGFPGKLKIQAEYVLTTHNELIFRYRALSNTDTIVNLTNHSYFNLTGKSGSDILSHELRLNAECYLPVDENLIPQGQPSTVDKTPFDFRKAKPIGKDIEKVGGYDHCFCINDTNYADKNGCDKMGSSANADVSNDGYDKDNCSANAGTPKDGNCPSLPLCAEVYEKQSGRKMSVYTDRPGVQFYTGNFLDIAHGKDGVPYTKYAGFCLETEDYPDAPNRPDFPSTVLKAGHTYTAVTVYAFDTDSGGN